MRIGQDRSCKVALWGRLAKIANALAAFDQNGIGPTEGFIKRRTQVTAILHPIGNCLKPEHEPLKPLKQRVVKLARNALSLRDSNVEACLQACRLLSETDRISEPDQRRENKCNKKREPVELEMSVQGPIVSNFEDVMYEAALQGLGILYVYSTDPVSHWISAGRLKRVLADWSPMVPGLFLYYPSRRLPTPALRAFIDCLLDRDVTQHDERRGTKRRNSVRV